MGRIHFREWAQRVYPRLRPTPGAWRGAAWGLIVLAVCLTLVVAVEIIWVPQPNPGLLLAVLALLLGAALIATIGLAGAWLLRRVPPGYLWSLGAALPVLVFLFLNGLALTSGLLIVSGLVFSATLLGGGLGALLSARRAGLTRLGRAASWLSLALGAALLGLGVYAVVAPGAPLPAAAPIDAQALDLPDPTQPGAYPVATLTYGSGADRRRPAEFGAAAGLITPPVDGSALVEGWDGLAGRLRSAYWGFDAKNLPLNARVWYPEGQGPFPLVLIVHGNHPMEDFSDAGYAYLGELLASRGYIAASIDENFLNFTFVDFLDWNESTGLQGENDARGWLLLEHLKLWRAWNAAAQGPFAGRVDLARIALIGHSRGGEAVAAAAAFNRLPYDPDNARVRFDYGFDIRAVIAIAPVDGQYRPAGRPAALRDIDYLVLHGAQDADIRSMSGARQYERVSFSGQGFHFKAALYAAGANHGQFNTTWGAADVFGWPARLLNRAALLPAADQQQIARLAVSAFLDAALREQTGYLALFRDPRAAVAGWLPATVYVSQYQDSSYRPLADFEEDIDLTTAGLPGARLAGENLDGWREQVASLRSGSHETSAVALRWDRTQTTGLPQYRVTLPEAGLDLNAGDSLLTFTLADARDLPAPGGAALTPLDLTLELADRAGNTARLPLSRFAPLAPPLSTQVMKFHFLDRFPGAEQVYQTFNLPLAAFRAANPRFQPAALAEIRFVFDQSLRGEVLLDHLGFCSPTE